MRQLKVVLLVLPLVIAGCGGWHDLFGSKRSAASQPLNCSRAQLEVIIARAGMACGDSNPCPSGSYCNTSGVCSWACYTDSECSTGQVCGCDGRCTGDIGGGADGGMPTTNLSCNKDATLLYKIKPGSSPTNIPPDACDSNGHCPIGATCNTGSNTCNWVRACDNDERCPAGSYCDPATGNCSWDCQPNVACPDPAQTCDCAGRCVVPGVAPTPGQSNCQARKTLTMGVSARTSFLTGDPTVPNTWTRTVGLTLSSPDSTLLVARVGLNPVAQTYVVPRDNLQVLCNGAYTSSPCALPLTGFGNRGSSDHWFVENLGQAPDPVTARATIQLQFQVPAPGVVASSWHADIFTPGATNSPQGVDFTFNAATQTISPTQPPPSWQVGNLPEGVYYRGTLQLMGATDLFSDTAAVDGAVPGTIPVVAQALGNQLYIVDPSHTLSASGTLVLSNGGGASYYLVNSSDQQLYIRIHGNPAAVIAVEASSNSLKGNFFVNGFNNAAAMFAANFSLTPIPAGQPVPVIPTEPVASGFPEPNYAANAIWQQPYSNNAYFAIDNASRVSSLWMRDLYDYNRGVSSPVHVKKPPLIDANFEVSTYPSNAGKEACSSAFLGEYISALTTPWTIANHTYQNIVGLPRPNEFFDICSINQFYSSQLIKDTYLPCVDGAHVEPTMRSQSSFNMSADCAAFRDNQQYSGNPVAKDYASWLAQDCIKVSNPVWGTFTVQLKDLTANAVAQQFSNELYICPQFKSSLVRIPTAASSAAVVKSDASPAEAAYCYEPNRGAALLWSGTLADGMDANNILEFSGDLLCEDSNGGTYAPKIFPLIEHADRVTRNESFPSSAANASELFDACMTELRTTPPGLTQTDLSANAIYGTIVKTFSEATCVSLPRFALMLNYFSQPATDPSQRDEKLLSHVLKQWVETHSFISYQGQQESRLRRVLASASDVTKAPILTNPDDPGSLPAIQYEELLDFVNQSWEPIFRVYNDHRSWLVNVINVPDYRDWSGALGLYSLYPDRQAHQDQWLPLPVVMIEGLTQELRLLNAYLDQQARAAYLPDPNAPNATRDQALARYGATMRMMYVVEGVATDLRETTTPSDAVVDRWNTAVAEMRGLREDARRQARGLAVGHNPLGIDEDDLPIFFGDPQGTNSQYFASSDYLMNQWAVPAVTAAETSIASARDAWLQARNSKIQDRMTQAQRDQRLDEIKSSQGQKIIENCGLTGVDAEDVLDAFNGGTSSGTQLQMATCFIDPSCLNRVNLTPDALTSKVTTSEIQFKLCTLNETAGYRNLPEPMATCASTGSLGNSCSVSDLYDDFNSGLVPADASQRADLVCQARLGFRSPLPTTQDMVGQMDPSCFRGKLGAAALQIIAARQDCDIALQNWNLAERSFDLDRQNCQQVESAESDAEMRASVLNMVLSEEAEAKFQAQWTLNAIDTASSWFSAVANAIPSFGTSLIGGVTALAEASPKEQVLLAQDAMDREQRDYNTAMALKQSTDTIRACWHNVDKSQLTIASAFAQIARRATDSATAVEQFQNMIHENVQALRQGTNDVKREKNRYISTVAHHYWLSEKVDKFDKDFAWAQRMTYLAMRAVEYEFQQTLSLRQQVLTASHPDQLQDTLRALNQEVGTRTINRRRPSAASVVLSLRDDVLALPDHSADPNGERQLTPTRGLEQRLTDPRFAIHDKSGNWLGQGVPFNLGPEGALNYRCGERLWRVTATVQGDGLSDSQPGVSLLVLKRNTFASQWCQGEGDGSRFQYGSVQPSRRLFGENGSGALESEANGFSTSLIYPWFNIRRTDFYKETYQDGASEELAGRGLYGDYVLLFPRDVLEGTANDSNACVAVKRGFPLDQVEDVLIRFDYLSVDNLPEIQQ